MESHALSVTDLYSKIKTPPLRFRCIVGHVYSPGAMRAEHARRLENALWSAIAGFEEHATILRRLAETSDSGSPDTDLMQLEEEARQQDGHAQELRAFMERVYQARISDENQPPREFAD